jgi:hypothetical protein
MRAKLLSLLQKEACYWVDYALKSAVFALKSVSFALKSVDLLLYHKHQR